MSKPLNPKQLKFVERYLATGNATQSYIDAGYNCTRDGAEASAFRLLGDVRVQQLLAPVKHAAEVVRRETITNIEITRDRIRLEMARLAFVNPKNLFNADGAPKPVHELDDDTAAAVAQIDIEERMILGEDDAPDVTIRTRRVKLWDKNRALQSLGDTEPGLWADDAKGEQPTGGTTNVNVTGPVLVVTLTAADIAAARRLMGVADSDLPADGGQKPLGAGLGQAQ